VSSSALRWGGADPFGRSRSTWEVNPGAQLLRKAVWSWNHTFGEDSQESKGSPNFLESIVEILTGKKTGEGIKKSRKSER